MAVATAADHQAGQAAEGPGLPRGRSPMPPRWIAAVSRGSSATASCPDQRTSTLPGCSPKRITLESLREQPGAAMSMPQQVEVERVAPGGEQHGTITAAVNPSSPTDDVGLPVVDRRIHPLAARPPHRRVTRPRWASSAREAVEAASSKMPVSPPLRKVWWNAAVCQRQGRAQRQVSSGDRARSRTRAARSGSHRQGNGRPRRDAG